MRVAQGGAAAAAGAAGGASEPGRTAGFARALSEARADPRPEGAAERARARNAEEVGNAGQARRAREDGRPTAGDERGAVAAGEGDAPDAAATAGVHGSKGSDGSKRPNGPDGPDGPDGSSGSNGPAAARAAARTGVTRTDVKTARPGAAPAGAAAAPGAAGDGRETVGSAPSDAAADAADASGAPGTFAAGDAAAWMSAQGVPIGEGAGARAAEAAGDEASTEHRPQAGGPGVGRLGALGARGAKGAEPLSLRPASAADRLDEAAGSLAASSAVPRAQAGAGTTPGDVPGAPGSTARLQGEASADAALGAADVTRAGAAPAPGLAGALADRVSGAVPGAASGAPGAMAPAAGSMAGPAAATPTSGGAPVADAFLAAAPGQAGFAPRLGAQLTVFAREGVEFARLHLNPAELGPVWVQIQLEGQAAQVHLAAENAFTREQLGDALPVLAGSLREAGLTLSGGGVFDQPRQRDAFGDPQRAPGGTGARSGTTPDAPDWRDAAPGTLQAPPRRRGIVDLIA